MYIIIISRFIIKLHTENSLFEIMNEVMNVLVFFGAVKILRFLNFEGGVVNLRF